jgi:2-methylisocitrate lyase-like PEP mutase family enzyme
MNNMVNHKRTQETSVNWSALGVDLAIVGLMICTVFISYFTARLLKTIVKKRQAYQGDSAAKRKEYTKFTKYKDVV